MITFRESSQTLAALNRIEAKIKELRQPSQARFTSVRRAIVAGFARNFATESAGGIPWQPLALSTVKQRALLGYGGAHPILERDGTYKRSFTELDSQDHASVFEYRDGKTVVGEGSQNPLAAFHEQGGSIIPRRSAIALDDSGRQHVSRELSDIVRAILNG